MVQFPIIVFNVRHVFYISGINSGVPSLITRGR